MKLGTYKDTLVHPNSELARLLQHHPDKAEAHYAHISREAVKRGEFVGVKTVMHDPWSPLKGVR